jgi:hypothetical protein
MTKKDNGKLNDNKQREKREKKEKREQKERKKEMEKNEERMVKSVFDITQSVSDEIMKNLKREHDTHRLIKQRHSTNPKLTWPYSHRNALKLPSVPTSNERQSNLNALNSYSTSTSCTACRSRLWDPL